MPQGAAGASASGEVNGVVVAALRRLRTLFFRLRHRQVLRAGADLHVGAAVRVWAPHRVVLGCSVYLGKGVHIECDARIGDFSVFANRVALVARRDYDFRRVGVPIRFSALVAPSVPAAPSPDIEVIVGSDVWIGFGAIVLSGVELGRGCVVGAVAVVTASVPPYAVVAGNPATIKGWRFRDEAVIAAHEQALAQGHFRSSERGHAHATVRPTP